MFIRIAEVTLLPGLEEEAKRIYAEEAAMRVHRFAGNVGCYMLEPVEADAAHLACTVWDSEESARAYESSGAAQEVAALLRHTFAAPPRLQSYRRP
jgi:heme-degrading monooxygenase HmoA